MLVACRLAGLSALVFDYAVAARVGNPADGVCSPSRLVRDSRTALGSDIGRKPAGSPGRPQGRHRPHIPPLSEGGARLTGRLKGLVGRSGSTNDGDVNLR